MKNVLKHMGTSNTRGAAVPGGRERVEVEGGTVGVGGNRLRPQGLKQTWQNVKIWLSWYMGVHSINVNLYTFMCT